MEQTKRPYEITFIINASLEDPQIEIFITQVTELITRNGGEITAVNKWGRKRLAYTIQKKNNGYYANIEFVAAGAVIPQVERMLSLDENVIRFLSILLDQRALDARKMPPPPIADGNVELGVPIPEPLFEDEADAILPKI